MLLIEFSEQQPFGFFAGAFQPYEILETHITSRLTLLCLHFPQLRFLWARSPRHSARLFSASPMSHERVASY